MCVLIQQLFDPLSRVQRKVDETDLWRRKLWKPTKQGMR